jgi:hypothetical protein
MRRRLLIIVSAALVVVAAGSVVLAHTASATSAQGAAKPKARQFVGYWMGIDPLDGGDSRRGITVDDAGSFAMIGRDTVFTLCDDTDRALITGTRGEIVGSALVFDDVVLECFGNGERLDLTVHFEPLGEHILREVVTTRTGSPVDEIVFHRVSQQ